MTMLFSTSLTKVRMPEFATSRQSQSTSCNVVLHTAEMLGGHVPLVTPHHPPSFRRLCIGIPLQALNRQHFEIKNLNCDILCVVSIILFDKKCEYGNQIVEYTLRYCTVHDSASLNTQQLNNLFIVFLLKCCTSLDKIGPQLGNNGPAVLSREADASAHAPFLPMHPTPSKLLQP